MKYDDLELPWGDEGFEAELKAIEDAPLAELDENGMPLRKALKPESKATERTFNYMVSQVHENDATAGAIHSADLSDLDEGEHPVCDI